MTWEYRVVAKKYIHKDGTVEYEFGLYEVYYNDRGKIKAVTTDPVAVVGYSNSSTDLSELEQTLASMNKALSKPILYWNEVMKEIQESKNA